MKKFLSFCLFAFIVLNINLVSAGKSYTCDLLNVTVTILPNGDAQITEDWTFTYNGDSFSAFIREIPNNAKQPLEKIIASEKGVNYKRLSSLTKKDPPNHFAIKKYTEKYVIETYFYAKNQTRTFTLNYTLRNAILMHNDTAEFYYKFIGETFQVPIARITANVYIPAGATKEDIRVWHMVL